MRDRDQDREPTTHRGRIIYRRNNIVSSIVDRIKRRREKEAGKILSNETKDSQEILAYR